MMVRDPPTPQTVDAARVLPICGWPGLTNFPLIIGSTPPRRVLPPPSVALLPMLDPTWLTPPGETRSLGLPPKYVVTPDSDFDPGPPPFPPLPLNALDRFIAISISPLLQFHFTR
jgi:hypothetical protein